MSFSDAQLRQPKASVRRRYVKERQADGKILHYLEGWWVVSEANRIFGFDAWERETVSSECVWRSPVEERFAAAYLTRVRVTFRAGDRVIVREGLGGGEAFAPTPGQAHERASKAAETDATKRALSTFGSRFGLSLYGERGEAAKIPHERVPLGRAAARVVKTVGDNLRAAAKAETTDFRPPPETAREAKNLDAVAAPKRASSGVALAGAPRGVRTHSCAAQRESCKATARQHPLRRHRRFETKRSTQLEKSRSAGRCWRRDADCPSQQ